MSTPQFQPGVTIILDKRSRVCKPGLQNRFIARGTPG
jgi:hypothetical protein